MSLFSQWLKIPFVSKRFWISKTGYNAQFEQDRKNRNVWAQEQAQSKSNMVDGQRDLESDQEQASQSTEQDGSVESQEGGYKNHGTKQ